MILAELYKQYAMSEKVVNRAKIVSLSINGGDMVFKDSLCFFQMPPCLPSPKPLDLRNKKKAFFPHFFNTPDNEGYIGPYLPRNTTIPRHIRRTNPRIGTMVCSSRSRVHLRFTSQILSLVQIRRVATEWRLSMPRIWRDQRFQTTGTVHHHRLRLQSLLPHETYARTSPGLITRPWLARAIWQTPFPSRPGMVEILDILEPARSQRRGTRNPSR